MIRSRVLKINDEEHRRSRHSFPEPRPLDLVKFPCQMAENWKEKEFSFKAPSSRWIIPDSVHELGGPENRTFDE